MQGHPNASALWLTASNLNSHTPKSYGGEHNNANVIAPYSLERESPTKRISKRLIHNMSPVFPVFDPW